MSSSALAEHAASPVTAASSRETLTTWRAITGLNLKRGWSPARDGKNDSSVNLSPLLGGDKWQRYSQVHQTRPLRMQPRRNQSYPTLAAACHRQTIPRREALAKQSQHSPGSHARQAIAHMPPRQTQQSRPDDKRHPPLFGTPESIPRCGQGQATCCPRQSLGRHFDLQE